MLIRLIAVDMDGTFLNRQSEYDRPRFARIYRQLKQRGVHFVVASGNQYYQLRGYFEPIADEISYAAENGGLVVAEGGRELFAADIPRSDMEAAFAFLDRHPDILALICCRENAYLPQWAPPEFVRIMRHYYPHLQQVEQYRAVTGDPFLKVALNVPEAETGNYVALCQKELGGVLEPTSSGHGCVDLIRPGLHKASALTRLMQLWQLTRDECMAFGDGGNDLEMLQLCGQGYAMANAAPEILQRIPLHAPANDESGVLQVIEQALADGRI